MDYFYLVYLVDGRDICYELPSIISASSQVEADNIASNLKIALKVHFQFVLTGSEPNLITGKQQALDQANLFLSKLNSSTRKTELRHLIASPSWCNSVSQIKNASQSWLWLRVYQSLRELQEPPFIQL